MELNHRMGDFQSPAVPLGYLGIKGEMTGLEPAISGATIQRVYHFRHIPHGTPYRVRTYDLSLRRRLFYPLN